MAIDVGVHRKQVYSNKPNVQEEQWKRAFWYSTQYLCRAWFIDLPVRVLVCLDLHVSLGMGRPSAIQSDEYAVVFLIFSSALTHETA
jgi:hypothetical protein